jgi:hypothetical protein
MVSDDRTRAQGAGFQVHLSKPVEPSKLLSTIASVVGRTGDRIELVKYFWRAGYERLWAAGLFDVVTEADTYDVLHSRLASSSWPPLRSIAPPRLVLDEDTLLNAGKAGFNSCIGKPVSKPELARLIADEISRLVPESSSSA